jgi:hypothetical protein
LKGLTRKPGRQVEELQAQVAALEATNRDAAALLREQARRLTGREEELLRLRAAGADAEELRAGAAREAAERERLERTVRRRRRRVFRPRGWE